MNSKISIVFITDDNYIIQTAVAITSVKETHTDKDVKIYVVGNDISDENKNKLLELVNDSFTIQFVDPEDVNRIKSIKGPDEKFVAASKAALYKFDLPNLVSDDKVLYLDGDVVIRGDLGPLFNTELDGTYAAVVSDLPQVLYTQPVFDEGNGRYYFNTGVMLLNLKKMREEDITNKLYTDRLAHKNDLLMDQNSFNRVFGRNVKLVSPIYNCTIANLTRSKNKYDFSEINELFSEKFSDLTDLGNKAVVLHYSSKDKPWTFFDAPGSDVWIRYFCLSPYSELSLKRYSKDNKEGVSYKKIYYEPAEDVIPVVFCTNDKYVPNLLVSALSVLKNSLVKNRIRIFVLYKELSNDNIKRIESLDKNISVLNISCLLSENEKNLKTCGHFSSDMYLRWYIPEIFYQYRKIIYLDCDIVCQADITELYQMSLENKVIGACLNLQDVKKAEYRERVLGVSAAKYINSGVLILDTHGFISKDYKANLFEFVRSNPKIDCPDQDAINVVCCDDIKLIDYVWNVQWHHYFQSKGKELTFSWKEYLKRIEAPKIIHYTSNVKPWIDKTKYKADLFWDYANEIGVSFNAKSSPDQEGDKRDLQDCMRIIKEIIENSSCSKLDLMSDAEFKLLNYKSRLFFYSLKQKDISTAMNVVVDISHSERFNLEEAYRKRISRICNSFSMTITRPLRKMEKPEKTIERIRNNRKPERAYRVYVRDNLFYLIRFLRKYFSEQGIFKFGISNYSKTYIKASAQCKTFFFALRNNDIEAAYLTISNMIGVNIQEVAKVNDGVIEDLYKLNSMILTRPIRMLGKIIKNRK